MELSHTPTYTQSPGYFKRLTAIDWLYGAALLVAGRAARKRHIPFGPFMIAGAFLVILAWHL